MSHRKTGAFSIFDSTDYECLNLVLILKLPERPYMRFTCLCFENKLLKDIRTNLIVLSSLFLQRIHKSTFYNKYLVF